VGLLACFLLAGCGTKKKEEAPAVDPNTVTLNEAGVSLGGVSLGTPPEDKMEKIDALFGKLKEQREQWKTAHPTEPFPGALTIDLGPNVTCNAALSVFMTSGFAGYNHQTIKQGTTTVEVPIAVPKPPNPSREIAPEDGRKGYLRFLPDGNVEFRPGRCGGAYDVVPPASVAATVKEWCGEAGDCLRALHLGCESGTAMSKILPVLAELRKTSAKLEIAGGGGACKPGEGAFTDLKYASDLMRLAGLLSDPPPKPAPPPGKKLPGLLMKEGKVETTGGITPEEVSAAMKPKREAFETCFATGLLVNPNLQGRVIVRLEIGKKGAVMAVSNQGADVPDMGVVECILEAASSIGLPAKGTAGTVSYPLLMSPK
jgi:hypothetical protein